MMFIDASAIVAILKPEADADELLDRLEKSDGPFFVSPLVRYEATVSLARARAQQTKKPTAPTPEMLEIAREAVDLFVQDIEAREIDISSEIGKRALDAATIYGKAIGHPADLNFGDCFAYACAKAYRLKLLYKGDDFAKTDLALI
jgi:ribonuclease VapC